MIRKKSKTVEFATANSAIDVDAPKGRRKKTVATKVKGHSAKHAYGFMDFIRTQGVVGLAVGLVLGGAVTILVKSLIDNVVMPPLGFVLGSAEGLKGLEMTIGKTGGKQAILHYGVFLNDLVNFIVIAIVIYLIVHMLGLDKLDKRKN
ncbi:MAG: MscL family protein [Candidatus Saccharibacteria bacterium]|nr:MscL family protein [Candidatus Saccharibacteria bacterium]